MRRRAALAFLTASALPARADDDLVRRLRSEPLAIVMRHAQTVAGTGDPPGFRLDDCSTQRNLSEAGRAQARATGAAWRDQRLPIVSVHSSAWCRCIETGELLGFGPVDRLPALNSFFEERERREAQTASLRSWVARREARGIAVLVTHQVNVTALTGVYLGSGESVVVTAAGEPIGRLGPYPAPT